jgi:hypothetical protein
MKLSIDKPVLKANRTMTTTSLQFHSCQYPEFASLNLSASSPNPLFFGSLRMVVPRNSK